MFCLGFECLSLDYHVKWPLSLVLSRRCLTRYQLIFRHLFSCKYVEREIASAWKSNKNKQRAPTQITAGLVSSDNDPPTKPSFVLNCRGTAAFALLQRMLNFIQGLQYYISYEVLEPTYRQLEKHLKQVTTIDEVLVKHTGMVCFPVKASERLVFLDFLDRCLKDCLLTNREVVELTNHLLQCCLAFAVYMEVS